MSYDVSLEADLGGPEPVRVGDLDANYTYNCGGMLGEATGGLWLSDMTGWDAAAVAVTLRDALAVMERDRPRFIGMNPENGWGDLDSWMVFLRKIVDACDAAPRARLCVS
jgi:hypothetical protein